jgi:hypothetical protein
MNIKRWLRNLFLGKTVYHALKALLSDKVELPARGRLVQFFYTARLAQLAFLIYMLQSAQLGSEGRAELEARRAARLMQGSDGKP